MGEIMNKVTKKDCMEAIEYLFIEGFVDEMTSDKKHYTKILLNKVANVYKMNLVWKK
jgi:hypothetical protein